MPQVSRHSSSEVLRVRPCRLEAHGLHRVPASHGGGRTGVGRQPESHGTAHYLLLFNVSSTTQSHAWRAC